MDENKRWFDPANPNRGPLIAFVAVIFLLVAGLMGASIWWIGNFINQPQPVASGTVMAATPVGPTAVGPTPIAAQTPLGAGLHGHVLSPDGTPVSGARVFVVLPGPNNLRIRNGKMFFENGGGSAVPRAFTDANGQYNLPLQSGNYLLEAMSDAGYAQLNQDATATNTVTNVDIKLTKWGRLQGRLMIGTKPGAGIRLQAWSVEQADGQPLVRNSMANFAVTDADGNFTMNCVVPGTIRIARDFPQRLGANTWGFTANVGSAQVAAGETTTVDLGGVGRPVVGKFIFPSTLEPSDYFINARAFLISQDGPSAQYFLDVDGQHNFRIDNVLPGDYRIHVFLQKVQGGRTAQPEQTKFTMPDIPGGVSDEPLTIPDIQLQ